MALTAIVVGAGISGMASAIALRRANFAVTVLERRDDVREIGQAMGITSNASRVLLGLGLDLQKMRPVDFAGVDIVKADTLPMQIVIRQTFPMDSSPSLFVHRVDCHEALKDLATSEGEASGPPVELRHGCSVVSYDPEKGEVLLESGESLRADLIVAADGVRSKAHKWVLNSEERPAKPTGISVVRFTIPTEDILADPTAAPLLQVSDSNKASMYVGADPKGSRVLRYPCRESQLQNFGIYTTRNLTDDPNGIWTRETGRAVAIDLLKDLNESVRSIATLADEKQIYLWKVADRDPFSGSCKDRMVLVGDACHPMRPNLGQGAGLGIEDGGVLGIVMKDVQAEQIPARLKLFEELRSWRTGSAQLLSRCSLAGNPWPSQEDFRNAQQFMGEDAVPTDVEELVSYFLKGDQLKAAEDAVAAHIRQQV